MESTEFAVAIPTPQGQTLPALIDRASRALSGARSSAEILEAREMASFAYDVAKKTARMAKAKKAHDDLIQAVYRAQADALEIEAGAKRRLADEYDAAQERGEVAGLHDGRRSFQAEDLKPTARDLGLTHPAIHEARILRDAERNDPGVTRRTLDERIDAGQEPSKAALREAIVAAALRGMRGAPSVDRRNKDRQPNPQFDALTCVIGSCADLTKAVDDNGVDFILHGFISAGMRERSIETITKARDYLSRILEAAKNVGQ